MQKKESRVNHTQSGTKEETKTKCACSTRLWPSRTRQAGRRTRVSNNNNKPGELSNRTIIYLGRRAKLQDSR